MNVLQGNSHSIGPANNGHNKKGPPNLKLVKVAINKSCSSTFPIDPQCELQTPPLENRDHIMIMIQIEDISYLDFKAY